MVYFLLVFDYGDNKLRHYIRENLIVFPLISNSNVKFEIRSEEFRSGSKIASSSSSSIFLVHFNFAVELEISTAKPRNFLAI